MENKAFTFKITDNEGIHTLQSDRDCIWLCSACRKEVSVTEESIMAMKDKNVPKCPECNENMKLHYWLDCQG